MLDVTARRPAVSLSPRQLEIVARLAAGASAKEIAGDLGISYWTVHSHLADARRRTRSLTNHHLIARIRRSHSRTT